jgi:hypothetical protein
MVLRLGALELLEDVGAVVAEAGDEAEEDADGGEAARDGLGGAALVGLVLEVGAVFVGAGGNQGFADAAEEVVDLFQIAAVRVEGVICQPTLGCKVDQERAKFRLSAPGIDWRAR